MFYLGSIDRGEVEEYVDHDDTFPGIMTKALVRFGSREPFSIAHGDETGPDHEVAYRVPGDPAEEAFARELGALRIVDATRLPANWRPGGGGGLDFLPVWDPASIPTPHEMARTSVRRSPYPKALQALDFFRETSYGNDVADSVAFAIGGIPYQLFVGPPRLLDRTEEHSDWFMLVRVDDTDHPGDPRAALDELQISDWDSIIDTDDPNELMRVIDDLMATEPQDDAARRFRAMEFGPGHGRRRESQEPPDDAAARFKLLELDQEPEDDAAKRFSLLEFNPRHRRNPSGQSGAAFAVEAATAAKEKFEEFHRKRPTRFYEGKTSPIPARVRELGTAKFVLYRSSKKDPETGRAVPKPVNYIHEHDAGVRCYSPARGGQATIDVPAFLRDAEALVLLGKCLGFGFRDKSGDRDAEAIKPLPDLYATPCGKALLVIQDRREVLAMVWGGALGVEARGIVG